MGKSQRGATGSMKTTFNQNNFSKVAICNQNRKTTAVKSKHENTRKVPTVRGKRRVSDNAVIATISFVVVFAAIYAAYRYSLLQEQMNRKCRNSKLRVLLIAQHNSTAINHVFERLNYEVVHDARDNWDILWSTADDSFALTTQLRPHQLVNRFPSVAVNISSQMFDSRRSKHLVRAFKLPEMERELRESRSKKFIVANCSAYLNSNASFVARELIDAPLILDDSLVEMSVLVLVTSLNPLRLYRFRDDLDFRFTPRFASTEQFFCLKSEKNAKLEKLVTKNHKVLSENANSAITDAFTLNEQQIAAADKRRKTPLNLIQSMQLMHFDFVVDESLNVYVSSVRDFAATAEFPESYERIIYAALKIAGAGSLYELSCRGSLECPMLSTLKDIVSASSCINYPCNESACRASDECELCSPCLDAAPADVLRHLHRSYREQMQRGEMRRIFPSMKHAHDESMVNQLSPANRLSIKWFRAKCEADSAWC